MYAFSVSAADGGTVTSRPDTLIADSVTDPYLPPGGANWNKLKDLPIKDYGWGYGDTVTDDTYQEKAAKKIETNGWWAAQYVMNGWQTFDLSPYYANGTLEFDAVGAAGGETFSIGFRDVVTERQVNGEFYTDADDNPAETSVDALTPVTGITTEWKHFSIPLKDIVDPNGIFERSRVQLLKLTGNDTPVTFWIANIVIQSPDKSASYAPIKVNQVGYLTSGEKYALVSGYYNELGAMPGTPFQVRKASDGSIAYSGTLSLVKAYDPSSGEKVLKADFSGLTDEGEYRLTVDGIGDSSVPFRIGDDVYHSLAKDVQKFFYYQRANVDLTADHAGIFARIGRNKDDANLPLESNPQIKRDVSGGWWDAGDLGKYVTAGATAVSDLLWAYESYPGEFSDNQLNIPESGNGVPDLLDEIKVETDFFLKMQDESTGGFYAYVNRDPAPNRFVMDGKGSVSIIPTAQTADTVGALAHAYIVMKDIPPLKDYAETLKTAAIRGWNFLANHPAFIAQPDGPYNDNDDANDRFYAAAALYRATGEKAYGDYVVSHYKDFGSAFDSADVSHGIGGMEKIGFYHYLSGMAPDAAVKAWFAEKFKAWRSEVIHTSTDLAVWRNSTNTAFYWGANSNVASVPVSLAIGSRILGLFDENNLKVAAGDLNYLLGINPLQLSFITGYGERRVTTTIHDIYNKDFILEMPNGYMPGGPNNNGRYTFDAKAYNSSSIDWETNEQALNYNSPMIYLTAMLSHANAAPSVSITSYQDGQPIRLNRPLITWTYQDTDIADTQTAYQVQASNDNWATVGEDSGELAGADASYSMGTLEDGHWSIRVRAKDSLGAWSEWAYRSLTIDTVAPTLTVTLDPATLWPANNRFVRVTARVEASDGLSQVESVVLESITPNVVVGDYASMVQEAEFVTLDKEFKLLAHKSKGKEPLVYTIKYKAADRAGNVAVTTATVTVPHDQSGTK
nr:glycoside hydrolase family 9 protein [Cohnella sp. CFH 77786]